MGKNIYMIDVWLYMYTAACTEETNGKQERGLKWWLIPEVTDVHVQYTEEVNCQYFGWKQEETFSIFVNISYIHVAALFMVGYTII